MTTPHLYDIGQRKQDIMDPRRVAATWRDVEWLRAFTKLPLVIKGILDPDDAELAIQAGAEAIVVSNHGGRNLDTAPAAIDALVEVADRVQGRVPLLVDGGIQRGTDVLKALALGARAVLIGRPYCYGLGVAGSAGVCRVVEILRGGAGSGDDAGRRAGYQPDRSIVAVGSQEGRPVQDYVLPNLPPPYSI